MKSICVLMLCAWVSIALTGQELEIYSPVQMHSDLNKFRHAIESVHPDLYEHISPREFDAIFNKLLSETSEPRSAIEFHNIVLELIACLHDGHSQVFAINKLRGFIYQQQLPFHTLVQDERIFIVRNLSDIDMTDGSEIISINGISSDAIILKLLNYFGGDGLCQGSIEYRFGSSYNSFYWVFPWIFGVKSYNDIVYRDYKTEEIKTAKFPLISNGDFRSKELKKYGNNLHPSGMDDVLAQKAFSFDLNDAGQYGFMKISRFFKDDYEEPASVYRDFYENAFRQLNEKKIKNLIIDLRGNGGGIGSNAAYLIQYLTDKPFTPTKEITIRGNDDYYKSITKDILGLDAYFGLKKVQNGKFIATNSDNILELKQLQPIKTNRYHGNLYVLIDEGTLSAGAMAAGMLRQYTKAVFVGEETGGHAGMSNGIRQLFISGDSTDIAINLPLLHSKFSIDEHLAKRGVVPDFAIANSIHDIIQGRDAVMNFVTNEIMKRDSSSVQRQTSDMTP